MVAPFLLPLAGLVGGLLNNNRQNKANQQGLLALARNDQARFANIERIQNMMSPTAMPKDPNVTLETMIGDTPGLLNVPSQLSVQRRNPGQARLLRQIMQGQENAKAQGMQPEINTSDSPALSQPQLMPTAASMPFRASDAQKRTMTAQQLLGMSNPQVQEKAAAQLVENLLPKIKEPKAVTPYTDLAKINIDFKNGLLTAEQFENALMGLEKGAVKSIADQFTNLTGAKVPAGFRPALDQNGQATGAVEAIPGAALDQKELQIIKKKKVIIGSLLKDIDSYENFVKKTGVKILAGNEQNKLNASYLALLMKTKEYLNLGVLNGPDLDIMKSMLRDPTSVWTAGSAMLGKGIAGFKGEDTSTFDADFFSGQLDVLRKSVKASLEEVQNVYDSGGIIPDGRTPNYVIEE